MKKHYLGGLFTVILILALDLGTKSWISGHFGLGQSKPIIDSFFSLTLVHNYGAAFGLGVGWSKFFFIVVTVVATGFLISLYKPMTEKHTLGIHGLSLILSGALGNVIDRIRLGYVVDFLDVHVKNHHWPAFNVADAAITVGAVFYGLHLLQEDKKSKNAEAV